MRQFLIVMMLSMLTVAVIYPSWPDFLGTGVKASKPSSAVMDRPADEWRRTSQGWEKATHRHAPSLAIRPLSRIHPAIIGSLVLLLSCGGLVAFSSSAGYRLSEETRLITSPAATSIPPDASQV